MSSLEKALTDSVFAQWKFNCTKIELPSKPLPDDREMIVVVP
jgi:hypothetical protein